jgi:hypothetical protein
MRESLEFCLWEHEFSKIPTMAARIRTPPHSDMESTHSEHSYSVNKLALLAAVLD